MPQRELLTPTERVQLFAFPSDAGELISAAKSIKTGCCGERVKEPKAPSCNCKTMIRCAGMRPWWRFS
jgi:hypothetical protein